MESLAKMRQMIMGDLEGRAERESAADAENQILDTIIKESKFPVPGSLVESHLHHMIHETQRDLLRKGLRPEDIQSHGDILHKKMYPQAERQIRVFFILDEIARLENIAVSEEEFEETFVRIAGETGQDLSVIRNYYHDRKAKSQLTSRLRQEKILKFLVDNASE